MRQKILFLAVSLVASGAAFGDASRYTATLAQPIGEKRQFMINGNLFRCEASTCVLASIPVDAGSVQLCRALQRRVGALTAYGTEAKPFDADKLAKCNASS